MTGTIAGSTVTLEVNDKGIAATMKGSLSGGTISGTLSVTCPGIGTGTGTWHVTRG